MTREFLGLAHSLTVGVTAGFVLLALTRMPDLDLRPAQTDSKSYRVIAQESEATSETETESGGPFGVGYTTESGGVPNPEASETASESDTMLPQSESGGDQAASGGVINPNAAAGDVPVSESGGPEGGEFRSESGGPPSAAESEANADPTTMQPTTEAGGPAAGEFRSESGGPPSTMEVIKRDPQELTEEKLEEEGVTNYDWNDPQ